MSGSWIKECKRILEQIEKLEHMKGQDRLDMVRRIRFIILALQRSLSGWIEWVNNPDVMAGFSLEELKKVNGKLAKLTRPFIQYDCEITSQVQKDLTARQPETLSKSTKRAKDKTGIFYIE